MRCVFLVDGDGRAVWSEELETAPTAGGLVERNGQAYIVRVVRGYIEGSDAFTLNVARLRSASSA
jgi:hypothetical protein